MASIAPKINPTVKETASQAESKRKVQKALEETLKNPKKLAEAREKVKRQAREELEARETVAGRKGPGFQKTVPFKRKFPPEIYRPFYTQCEASKGSIAVCECILVKLELAKGEKEKSVAELLAVEVALKQGDSMAKLRSTLLPPNARVAVRACVS